MLLTVAHARLCAYVVFLMRTASLTLRFRVRLNLLRGGGSTHATVSQFPS